MIITIILSLYIILLYHIIIIAIISILPLSLSPASPPSSPAVLLQAGEGEGEAASYTHTQSIHHSCLATGMHCARGSRAMICSHERSHSKSEEALHLDLEEISVSRFTVTIDWNKAYNLAMPSETKSFLQVSMS